MLKKISRRILRSELHQLAVERHSLDRLATTLTPIDEFQDTDVFIAGYPKSGNTWMQLLVASVMYGLDPMNTPDTLIQELVPDIHYKTFYKRFGAVTCFKTHALPQREYKRVLNIVRDGRDVLCSYRSFSQALGGVSDIDAMLDGDNLLEFGTWRDHVLAWNANPFNAEVLTIRYEDLKTNCSYELQRISEFLGLSRCYEDLVAIAELTQVDNMKERERKLGWDNKVWPADKAFVRRGVSGYFKDELSKAQIIRFNELCGDALKCLDYPL